jgi:hypothetical protein
MRHNASKWAFAAVLLLAGAVSSPAAAGDAATADALFQAGKELVSQKKYAEACPKFEASYRMDPTLGTLLNLADCHEKQGLLARPWSEWGEALDTAKREGDTARMQLAERHRTALEPRVPRLRVQVKGTLNGLYVWRDDVRLEESMLGVHLPVEPGAHVVTIRRGNQVVKEAKVNSVEKARDDVTLDATSIPAAAAPYPYAPPAPGAYAYPPMPPPKPKTKRKNVGLYAGGIVAVSLGATVGSLAGLATYAVSVTEDGCKSGTCRGLAAATIGGVVLFAAGIPMIVIGGKKVPVDPEPPPKASFSPQFVLSPSSASLRLSF